MRSIREYRIKNTHVSMPRILVIIDEFQLMFDNPKTSQKNADLLEKSIRLFRAAGIHFILASQTLSDTGNIALSQKRESLFSQVPIRIALKNSINESHQTLGINNSAAAFLKPREAIVNLDYGEPSQNRKTVIAYADEALLKRLRRNLWEKALINFNVNPPYVFESEKRITIKNSAKRIVELHRATKNHYALIGKKISINGEPVALPMTNEYGRNIAIIGTPDSECNNAYGIIQSAAISLAAQHPEGTARFVFCDFSINDHRFDRQFPIFTRIMEKLGYFIECLSPDMFNGFLSDIKDNGTDTESIYIFGANMDRWDYEKDPYVQSSPLKSFVETSPVKGIHFIGWWQKASNYNAQVSGYGSSDAFNSKIFLRIDERTVQSLTTPFVRWTSQNNRALINDAIELSEEMIFIPYAPVEQDDLQFF